MTWMRTVPASVVMSRTMWACAAWIGSYVSQRLYLYARMRCLAPFKRDGEICWPRTPQDHIDAALEWGRYGGTHADR